MAKRNISFISFEDSEKENLEDSLKRTVQERLDHLGQLQKIYYELKQENNLQFEEPEENYIVLKRKQHGAV